MDIIDDIDDDEDGFNNTSFNGRDGVIFLVDASKSITGNPDKFHSCLSCIEAGMMNRIISSNRDLVSII